MLDFFGRMYGWGPEEVERLTLADVAGLVSIIRLREIRNRNG